MTLDLMLKQSGFNVDKYIDSSRALHYLDQISIAYYLQTFEFLVLVALINMCE